MIKSCSKCGNSNGYMFSIAVRYDECGNITESAIYCEKCKHRGNYVSVDKQTEIDGDYIAEHSGWNIGNQGD